MPVNWNVEFDRKNLLVLLTYKGLNAASDIYNSSFAAIELSRKVSVTQILVDARRFKTDCSRTEIFRLPYELYHEWGLSRIMQIALLEPRDSWGRQITSFYELSTVRLGWRAKIFKDRKLALQWLSGQ